MRTIRYSGMLSIALVLLGACAERDGADDGDVAAGAPDTAAATGMQSMPGMGGMQSEPMMDELANHMEIMRGASGDSMQTMLPMHRQMAANLLSQMNSEMRDMNMSGDAQWNATADSVRNDLTRLPDMTADELGTFMPAHQERMRRLMDMHRTMMREHGM